MHETTKDDEGHDLRLHPLSFPKVVFVEIKKDDGSTSMSTVVLKPSSGAYACGGQADGPVCEKAVKRTPL